MLSLYKDVGYRYTVKFNMYIKNALKKTSQLEDFIHHLPCYS